MHIIQRYYKQKFILLVMMVFIFVIVLSNAILYRAAKVIIEDELSANAQALALATSMVISNSIEGYEALLESRDSSSAYYSEMQKYLKRIKDESSLKYIYTESRVDTDNIEFILDSDDPDSPDHVDIGTRQQIDQLRINAYDTKLPVKGKLTVHPVWGSVISAYVPIFSSKNEFLGLIGVDFDGSLLVERLNEFFITIIITSTLLIGFIFILLIKFSDVILMPMMMDGLTSIYNKKFFDRYLQTEMNACSKSGAPLTILMLDLDHFKKVNDTYGHAFGDKVLKSITQVVKNMLRKSDCFARYGGEEFIIALSDTNLSICMEVAERIRKRVSEFTIYNEEKNVAIKITISIGAAQLPSGKISLTSFIRNADKALYESKVNRNTVTAYKEVNQ